MQVMRIFSTLLTHFDVSDGSSSHPVPRAGSIIAELSSRLTERDLVKLNRSLGSLGKSTSEICRSRGSGA
jgi:hypothetical protein